MPPNAPPERFRCAECVPGAAAKVGSRGVRVGYSGPLEGGPNSDEYGNARSESYHSNQPFCNPTEFTYSSYRQNQILADHDGLAYFNWDIVWYGDCWSLLSAFYEYWVE